MSATRRCAWLLLVLLCPDAAAGTEESPELSDPGGDAVSPTLTGSGDDILAVWVHDESTEGFQITLKLVELDATDELFADAYWSREPPGPRPPVLFGGVRAQSTASGVAYRLLEGAYPGTHFSDFKEASTLDGSVSYGEPAYVTWRVPSSVLPLPVGTTFVGWGALTYLATPLGPFEYRDAALSGRPYQLGLDALVVPFDAPQRAPAVVDPAGDVEPMGVDLREVWIEDDPTGTRVTVALAQVGSSRPGCHAQLLITVPRPGLPHLGAGVVLRQGPNRTHGVERVQEAEPEGDAVAPRSIQVATGQPGLVRFVFSRTQEDPPSEVAGVRAAARAQPPCPSGQAEDVLDPARGSPAVPALALVGALAWAAARRKL